MAQEPAANPSTSAIRSGDLVNQSVTTTGLIGALLSPWIGGALKFITDHSYGYLSFGDGYDTQLTMAIVVVAMAIQGRLHMRSIRKIDEQPESEPEDQERQLEELRAELARLGKPVEPAPLVENRTHTG